MVPVVAAALVASVGGPAMADACPPAARVVGAPALVAPVERLLRARGVAVDVGDGAGGEAGGRSKAGGGSGGKAGDAACAVHAELLPDERGVRVRITDPDGRTVERVAADPEIAATAIESWARQDLDDPLLAARVRPGSSSAGATASGATASRATTSGEHRLDPGAAGRGVRARRIEVHAALDGGASDDGALWAGGHAGACATVGDLCLGALVRFAADPGVSGDTETLDHQRSAFDLTLLAALPLDRDRWTLWPHAGLGLTSLTATRDLADEPEREQASSPHALAGLGVVLHLSASWSARLDGSVAVAPFATTRLGEDDGVDRQLAALPHARAWLALGLSYGGR